MTYALLAILTLSPGHPSSTAVFVVDHALTLEDCNTERQRPHTFEISPGVSITITNEQVLACDVE
jgi:hypothetical protein